MRTAESLAQAVRHTARGIFLLTWREKAELARACLVLRAALEDLPIEEFTLNASSLSAELLRVLEARQTAESGDAPSPLLVIYLTQTVGRTAGRALNGWRRGLACALGSIIVIHASEVAAFCADAPDLTSFLLGQRAEADAFLALWSDNTAAVLRRWLAEDHIILPRALAALPGGDVDLAEVRQWLAHHLNTPRSHG